MRIYTAENPIDARAMGKPTFKFLILGNMEKLTLEGHFPRSEYIPSTFTLHANPYLRGTL